MAPDLKMTGNAINASGTAIDAVSRFNAAMAHALKDGTHKDAYHAIRALAEDLQGVSSQLNHAALDADERLTPAARK